MRSPQDQVFLAQVRPTTYSHSSIYFAVKTYTILKRSSLGLLPVQPDNFQSCPPPVLLKHPYAAMVADEDSQADVLDVHSGDRPSLVKQCRQRHRHNALTVMAWR